MRSVDRAFLFSFWDPSIFSKAVPPVNFRTSWWRITVLWDKLESLCKLHELVWSHLSCVLAPLWLRSRIRRSAIHHFIYTLEEKQLKCLSSSTHRLKSQNVNWDCVRNGIRVIWNGGHLVVSVCSINAHFHVPAEGKHVQALFLWACMWGNLYFCIRKWV